MGYRATTQTSLAVVLFSMAMTPAYGQETVTEADEGVETGGIAEIVVTAQFRQQNLQDTPLAITAVTSEMMEARSQTDVTQLATRAPNVTMTPAGGDMGGSVTAHIRGVGQQDFNFALEPGVGMYVDDVYYGILFGSAFELTDLERVEILRGPQGTLAGKNSIGGAIKLFSKKPRGQHEGYVEATYGSFNRIDLRAGADFTLSDGTLYGRVSGLVRRSDGYLKRIDYECATGFDAPGNRQTLTTGCEIGTEGAKSIVGTRGALRWLASDRVESNLIVDFTRDESEPPPTKLTFQAGPWPGGNNYLTGPKDYTNYETYIGYPGRTGEFLVPSENLMQNWGVSHTLDVDISRSLALKSITAYRETSGHITQVSDASPASVLTNYWDISHEQWTQEVRLSGEIADWVEWTVGGFYYKSDAQLGGRINVAGGLVPGGGAALLPGNVVASLADFLGDDTITSENKSGFAHVVLNPIEDLRLTAGVRYTDDKKDYTFIRLTPAGGPHPTLSELNGFTGRYSASRWDYRVALDYQWTRDLMTYAQFSTGFKGGGVNPRPYFADQVLPFGPETLDAFELGWKSDLFDRRVRLNGAVFLNKYRDLQLGLLTCPAPSTPAPCNLPANVGDAEMKGAELELEIMPVEGLTFDGSVSYIDFKYEEVDPTTGVTPDMESPYTPKWKVSAGLQYEVEIPTGSVTPRIDFIYQSDVYSAAVNNPYNLVEGYGLLNGRITYRDAGHDWQISLAVTNITDKFYYLNKYDRASAPYFLANGQPGRPREWSLTVKRSF